jgi:hypothetical protein
MMVFLASAHSSHSPARPQAVEPKLLSHRLELLSGAASRQLFQARAGRQDAKDAGPGGLEDRVISACGGLPLALKLAGGYLRRQCNAVIWQVRCSRCMSLRPWRMRPWPTLLQN